jgi:hypothetical protein
VALWIVHDQNDSFVVVVTHAGPLADQALHVLATSIDIVDLNVEVDAGLAGLGFGNALEGQARLVIAARSYGGPIAIVPVFIGLGDVEHSAPERSQSCRVGAVDRDAHRPIHHAFIILQHAENFSLATGLAIETSALSILRVVAEVGAEPALGFGQCPAFAFRVIGHLILGQPADHKVLRLRV